MVQRSEKTYCVVTAFTLAEVLITLGIIGVVAALTLPTVINNVNSKIYKVQYRKTFAVLANAINLNKAKYDWNFADLVVDESNCGTYSGEYTTVQNADDSKTVCAFVDSNMQNFKWLGPVQTKPGTDGVIINNIEYWGPSSPAYWMYYQLAAGPIFGIGWGSENCRASNKSSFAPSYSPWKCTAFIDVNGVSGPNEEVKCKDGSVKYLGEADYIDCEVDNKSMRDMFPLIIYDGTVEPASNAARYVLYNK